MTTCRICGIDFREGDDVVELGKDDVVHHDCAEASFEDQHRTIMTWGVIGSTNQLEMGPVQLEE